MRETIFLQTKILGWHSGWKVVGQRSWRCVASETYSLLFLLWIIRNWSSWRLGIYKSRFVEEEGCLEESLEKDLETGQKTNLGKNNCSSKYEP